MHAEKIHDRQARWFCIVTNPNCQRRAELGLAYRGYRTFWPKYRKWASHARVKIAKEYPLFGRYLFVEVEGDNFGAAKAIDGVEGFVGIAGEPVPMPGGYVEDLWRRYLDGEWDFVREFSVIRDDFGDGYTVRHNPIIPESARIRLMIGEFEDRLAKVLGYTGKGKVRYVPYGQQKEYRIGLEHVRAA